jgi:outer membrane receptor protein involved in Fe transport
MFRSLSTAVLLLLLALPGVALAQGTGTLAGRVIDAQSGETLIGANVRIDGTTLGAATNINGEFRIIGVPVGTYTVTASYTGYTSQTVEEVSINNGYTRELNFDLSGSAELGEVVVEYERPIIQRDAIGTPRVVSGQDLENLPIRSVAGVTALTGGVVSTDNSSALNIRGGRSEEVAYYVDGVRVTGLLGVNQQAVQEQEVLIGTIPARYGDVQSGVVSITTKTGRQDFFGSAEFITSEGLDSFGYNLASLSLGGPVVPGRVGFFLSGEYNSSADSSPYGTDTYRLNDATYADLQMNPQALPYRDAAGNELFLPFPAELIAAQTGPIGADSLQALLLAAGTLPEGATLLGGSPIDRAETFTANDFDIVRGKDDPLRDLTFNGNLNFDMGNVNLRLGGGLATRRAEEFSFTNSLYNRTSFNNDERDSYRVYGTFRQRISNTAFYQLQGEFQDFQYVQYPEGFSDNIEDVLRYGDIDDPTNQTAGRYYVYRDVPGDGIDGPVYDRQFTQDAGTRPVRVRPGTFSLPGRVSNTNYQKSHNQRYRFSGNATTQLGVNQIEFGGEYQQDTQRFYSINAYQLAGFVDDENGPEQAVEGFPDGITSYTQLPFNSLRNRVTYYGFNYLGTEEVNDQSVDGYFPNADGVRSNTNIDAYRPRYYAGYIQDKIEFRDLIIQLGVRVDVFDNNTLVLKDIYAPTPIQRADALGSVPAGIESDYAVYYNGNNVVGYRDTNGNFYDAEGVDVNPNVVLTERRGQVRSIDAPMSTVFEDYTPQATFMPRVGVSFPVTDRALFFASYNVTSQRPTEQAFAPISFYEELDGQQSRVPNPTLEPELTTQYELGFRQRLGERAAVSLSGFYRTQENKISNRTLTGGFPAYGSYLNVDFTTTQGAELNFDLRRTSNLAINANYTLSFAQGTGSDAGATANIVWRGDYFPQFINPSDFDQRHTANVTLDYRLGAGEGPMLGGVRAFENFGINLIGQFGSGLRYTRLRPNTTFAVFDSFTEEVDGTINGASLPSTSRVDLRVDRAFALGFSESKLRAYLSVINLFDTENVLAVYRGTGLPDQDGYANTANGQTQLNNPGRLFNYQAYVGGPVNVGGNQSSGAGLFYGSPRQIRLGFLFDF